MQSDEKALGHPVHPKCVFFGHPIMKSWLNLSPAAEFVQRISKVMNLEGIACVKCLDDVTLSLDELSTFIVTPSRKSIQ